MRPVQTTLVFHKSVAQVSFGVTNIPPKRLISLLDNLHRAGFSLDGQSASPRSRNLTITFDDGYGHLMELLPKLVDRFDIRPLVFVPTDLIGKPNTWDYSHLVCPCRHLTREEIRRLDELGVEFGSHGHQHVDLCALNDRDLFAELKHSKGILENLLGKPITQLSYPFGRFNARVAHVAHAVGFSQGFTMRLPDGSDSALAKGRVPVYGYDTLLSVRCKLLPGPWRQVEALKAVITNRLSRGTILLNSLRRYS